MDRVTLDQLIVLNDEIAALVSAGVPLDRGLLDLGRDVPGRLGRIADRLGAHMEQGVSLESALQSDPASFPPIYSAVVMAGVRSGRLGAALEGLSESARRLADMRRSVGLAILYPLLILLATYGLFLYGAIRIVPTLIEMQEFDGTASRWLTWVAWLGEHASAWAIWPPLALLIAIASSWFLSARLGRGTTRGWTPWARLRRAGCLATFTELLALLTQQRMPVDESLVLAGQASGDRRLAEAAKRLADRLRRGELPTEVAKADRAEMPAMVVWLLAGGRHEDQLSVALRHVARQHQRRVQRLTEWFTSYLPLLLTAVVGGAAVLLYAAAILLPWFQMLTDLAQP